MVVLKDHLFKAQLEWTGAADGPTKDIRSYSRACEIRAEGKATLDASAAKGFLGDGSRWNPEELLLASLTACQMLTYLALAAKAGIEVIGYCDDCEATLGSIEGKWQITQIVLRPRIEIAAGDADEARALVEDAHKGCFIARSVSCPVATEPEIVVGQPDAT